MNKVTKRSDLICYIAMASLGLYLAAYQYAVTDITTEFSLQGWATGLVVACHFAASFFLPPIAGELADRFGRKPVLCGAFILMAAGMLCSALSSSIWLLMAGAMIAGGGSCTIESSMSSLLSQTNPEQETRVMNLSQMAFCAGAIISPIYGSLLQSFGLDWRIIYLTGVAAVLITGAFVMRMQLPPAPPRQKGLYLRQVLKNPYFVFLLICMLIYVGIEESAGFWAGSYVEKGLGGIVSKSWLLVMYWLGMCVGRLAASAITKRLGIITIIGLAVCAVFLVLTLVWPTPVRLCIAFLGAGLGIAPAWPLIMANATVCSTEFPDTSAGAIMSAGCAGGMLLPTILGVVETAAGMRTAFAVLTGIVFLFCALLASSKNFRKS